MVTTGGCTRGISNRVFNAASRIVRRFNPTINRNQSSRAEPSRATSESKITGSRSFLSSDVHGFPTIHFRACIETRFSSEALAPEEKGYLHESERQRERERRDFNYEDFNKCSFLLLAIARTRSRHNATFYYAKAIIM